MADALAPARQHRIPAHLPIHVIAGNLDPVSDGTRTLVRLLKAFESCACSASRIDSIPTRVMSCSTSSTVPK